jgi:hypothetical protein
LTGDNGGERTDEKETGIVGDKASNRLTSRSGDGYDVERHKDVGKEEFRDSEEVDEETVKAKLSELDGENVVEPVSPCKSIDEWEWEFKRRD